MKRSLMVKQVIAFLAVALITGCAGAYLIFSIGTVDREYQLVVERYDPANTETSNLEADTSKINAAVQGYAATRIRNRVDEMNQAQHDAKATIATLETLVTDPADLPTLKQIGDLIDQYAAVAQKAVALFDQGKTAEGEDVLTREGAPLADQVAKLSSAISDKYEKLAASEVKLAETSVTTERRNGVIILLAAVVVAVVYGMVMARSITRPIIAVAATAAVVAAGNLTVEPLKVTSKDEVGAMAQAFNQMVLSLRTVIGSVTKSTQFVSDSASALTAAATQASNAAQGSAESVSSVAAGASEQSVAAVEVNRTMEELRQTINQIATGATRSATEVNTSAALVTGIDHSLQAMAENAAGAAAETQRSADTAKNGAQIVVESVDGMTRIREVVGETAARLKGLAEFTAQIGDITEVISGIADQTNLLALNAAIEAARAGEHGRGFAVVADEVRTLAERSSNSAKEISGLIHNIQAGTADAVQAMDAGIQEVERGSKLTAQAGQALNEILASVQKAAHDVESIAAAAGTVREGAREVVAAFEALAALTEENTAATEEMAAGSSQVTGSVNRIAEISQSNAAATEEVAAAVEELAASSREVADTATSLQKVAEELKHTVSQFKV